MSAAPTPAFSAAEAARQAKRLLRLANTAALATLDRATGAPLASLAAITADADGAPLLLLSTLARHTGNLAVDRRGSLLLTGPPGPGDPLNRPRLTISGPIDAYPAAPARARFLARHPKARLYASFADFSMFRMDVSTVHFNGGFARAAGLAPADLLTDVAGAELLIAAEPALLEELNDGEAAFRARLAGNAGGRRIWRAIGLDPEGLDLAAGGRSARVSFAAPAATPQAWRAALVDLAAG